MSGQALCKSCTSVGSSCYGYMRWLHPLYQTVCDWSLLDSVSAVWGWGSCSCHAFPRSNLVCGLVPIRRMKMLAGSILGWKWGCWYILFKSSFLAGCIVSFSEWLLTGTTALLFIAVVCTYGCSALLICHKSLMPNVVSFSAPLYHLQRFLQSLWMAARLLLCGIWV